MTLPAAPTADATDAEADATDAAEAEADGWTGGNTSNSVRLENVETALVSAVLEAVEVLRFVSAARRSRRLAMYFNSLNFLSLAVCKISMWSISVLVWLSMNS